MSYENPTALRIGTSGALRGHRYRVAGRVVLGVNVDGETYYWNEYNLMDESGLPATLVYEEGEWKLFTLFEPSQPMPAAQAEQVREGQTVNLDGTPTPVTLVGQSRVYHIEGQAPEDVEVGDIARYFNADAGPRMVVASWTGEDIEFYYGVDLREDEVNAAFSLSRATAPGLGFTSSIGRGPTVPEPVSSTGVITRIMVVVMIGIIGFAGYKFWQRSKQPKPADAPKMRSLELGLGASGTLGVERYTVLGSAIVEYARADKRYFVHEYQLNDSAGTPCWLIQGLTGPEQEWHLAKNTQSPPPLTPRQAAAKRTGETLGRDWQVRELVQGRLSKRDGQPLSSLAAEPVWFGFLARDGNDTALVRWNENTIEFLIARPMAPSAVKNAFQSLSR